LELILFDLDNTLLAGDSDYEWAQFLIEKAVLDREVYEARNTDFYEQYKAGTLDMQEFLDFQLKPLSRHPRRVLDQWHREFLERKVIPMIPMAARSLVRESLDRTPHVIIITATNRFVTAPIAREFGIEHLIATEAEERDGEFTGRVVGVPSFREGKITRLEQWFAEQRLGWQSFSKTLFYSDSLNDLPLLQKVSHPVAVDPDETLRAHAERRGWPVISLRQ
jgi:HAD superfamily hydrolase (TIGR01490 family)